MHFWLETSVTSRIRINLCFISGKTAWLKLLVGSVRALGHGFRFHLITFKDHLVCLICWCVKAGVKEKHLYLHFILYVYYVCMASVNSSQWLEAFCTQQIDIEKKYLYVFTVVYFILLIIIIIMLTIYVIIRQKLSSEYIFR